MGKLISVIIPTYNRLHMTTRAVDSVVCGQPNQVEIIVVDDFGSETYTYNQRLNVHGIEVVLVRSTTNQGAGAARQIGINQSNGILMAFLDSDDVFEPDWLDQVIASNATLEILEQQNLLIAGRGKGGKTSVRIVSRILESTPEIFKCMLYKVIITMFNPFYTSSLVVSKNICNFSNQLRYCEDYYLNAMIGCKIKKLILLPLYACTLAREPGSIGGESNNKMKMFQGEMEVRRIMLTTQNLAIPYKILFLLGMIYQIIRSSIKELFIG